MSNKRRSKKVSRTLTREDAEKVFNLAEQGLAQHQIAAILGCNQGRISEILNGKRFPEVFAKMNSANTNNPRPANIGISSQKDKAI